MSDKAKNLLVILGPTASGKTHLGVSLAHKLGGEILSADSRQVYRGLDIGSGKDLDEYFIAQTRIPHHLIDIVDLTEEFSVFEFQKRFYQAFESITARGVWPVLVGGTGLYIESALLDYRMIPVPENPELRAELAALEDQELEDRLSALKDHLHNLTDLTDRDRMIRAIEIATHTQEADPPPAPRIDALTLGTRWPREVLRERIRSRLEERLDAGLIQEVERLHEGGISWERLELLGLEYRFVSEHLQGKIRNRNDLIQKLAGAIGRFSKRQETWFRRMERRGVEIHWIDRAGFDQAWDVVVKRLGSDQFGG